MKILIRAEGGDRIGMGHVMRMLVLADVLREYAEVGFACRDLEQFASGSRHIKSWGYPVYKINGNNVAEGLAKLGCDCLITDSYEVDEEYFKGTKDAFGITGYIDDINKSGIDADFIVNQNIYATDLDYRVKTGTKLLLGAQYILLRKEFRNLHKRKTAEDMRNVLITMGGTDHGNLSEKLVLILGKAFPEMTFHIAAGPAFTSIGRLKEIAGSNVVLHVDPSMSVLMQRCDAAVSACGSTIYELCACGTPAIGLVTASNQILLAEKMAEIGVIRYAREAEELIEMLAGLEYCTRERMASKGKSLIDGNGSLRLAQEIKKMLCS